MKGPWPVSCLLALRSGATSGPFFLVPKSDRRQLFVISSDRAPPRSLLNAFSLCTVSFDRLGETNTVVVGHLGSWSTRVVCRDGYPDHHDYGILTTQGEFVAVCSTRGGAHGRVRRVVSSWCK